MENWRDKEQKYKIYHLCSIHLFKAPVFLDLNLWTGFWRFQFILCVLLLVETPVHHEPFPLNIQLHQIPQIQLCCTYTTVNSQINLFIYLSLRQILDCKTDYTILYLLFEVYSVYLLFAFYKKNWISFAIKALQQFREHIPSTCFEALIVKHLKSSKNKGRWPYFNMTESQSTHDDGLRHHPA